VLDPTEVTFDFADPAMFEDVESGRELYVDPEGVRSTYLARFSEHEQAIRKTCANLGIDYYQLTTDQPLELTLFDFMHARMRRGRQVSRRQRSSRSATS
jgi:hypothetical protein